MEATPCGSPAFEALGFERRHAKTGIGEEDVSTIGMRYAGEDGKAFHVNIVSTPVPRDVATIRMNIRGFDEAYQMLEEKGFKNTQADVPPENVKALFEEAGKIY